jgi:hypothetical protein
MNFFDIILRIVTRAGFTTKASGDANNLTPTEVDNNFLAIVDEVQGRDIAGAFATWSAGTVEAGEVRIYDSKLWLALTTNSATPSEGTDWTQINLGTLGHAQNTDTYLDRFGTNEVTAAQIKSVVDNVGNEFYFDVTIPSADVLTLNTTPIELVPAQGANKIIVPTTILAEMDYNTTPYATNGNLVIKSGGGWFVAAAEDTQFLFGTVSRIVNIMVIENDKSATTVQYVANQPLTVEVLTGNPTAGDSNIRIFGYYKVIDIS